MNQLKRFLGLIWMVLGPIAIGLTIFGWYAWKGEYKSNE